MSDDAPPTDGTEGRRRMPVTTLAEGTTVRGDRWALRQESSGATPPHTWISVRTAEGTRHTSGYGSPALGPGQRVTVYSGMKDNCPSVAIVRVGAEVSRGIVVLSDGSFHELPLVTDPSYPAARLGPIVFPHSLKIVRIDLLDPDGIQLYEWPSTPS